MMTKGTHLNQPTTICSSVDSGSFFLGALLPTHSTGITVYARLHM